MIMLFVIAILWLLAVCYTVHKRGRQIQQIQNKLNQYIHEKEKHEASKGKEAEKESSEVDPT